MNLNLPKLPDWFGSAVWLVVIAFIAHFAAYIQSPTTNAHPLEWRWFAVAIPTCVALGLIAGLISDIMHLSQLPALGMASVMGWLGTSAITSLFQTIIDRVRGKP